MSGTGSVITFLHKVSVEFSGTLDNPSSLLTHPRQDRRTSVRTTGSPDQPAQLLLVQLNSLDPVNFLIFKDILAVIPIESDVIQ